MALFDSSSSGCLSSCFAEKKIKATSTRAPALPIIGHMHLLLGSTHPAQLLAHLSKRYGPLMSLKLGSIRFIVASSPEAARQILQTHDHAFSYRAPLATVNALYGDFPGITFSDPGPHLKFLRQLCATDLFNLRRLKAFKFIRDEEVKELLHAIFCAVNECPEGTSQGVSIGSSRPIHLRPHLQVTANNIISRMVMREKAHIVRPLVLEVIEASGAFNVGDFLPWMRWADMQGCVKHCKKAARKLHAALQDIIEKRRAQRAGVYDPPADILDMLLSPSRCPPDGQIKDASIRAALMDILAGGSNTSSLMVEWTMAELLANPSKLKAAEEEIQGVLSSKRDEGALINEDDIQSMPYLRAIVKEAMRLHPLFPLLIPKECRKSCNIFGYEIPAKTQAYVNAWAIGRDPKVWNSPNEFLPERFFDNNIDVRGQHFELLPFGSGRRVCPGQNLGLLTVHITIAGLLQGFSWRAHDLEHDMSEKVSLLTTKAKPLLALATPKLPRQFYIE